MLRLFTTLAHLLFAKGLYSQSQFFTRPLDPGRISPGNEVISTGPDEYLFSSFYFPGGISLNGGQINLTRLTPAGQIIWSNDYEYPRPLVAGALENWAGYQSYLFGGLFFDPDTLPAASLTRLSQDGTVLWSKSYGLDSSFYWINNGKVDIVALPDGNALLGAGASSFTIDANANDLSLLKVDLLGDLLWGKTYCFSCESDVNLTFGNVVPTADSGYVVSGSIRYPDLPNLSQDVFLMKVDTAGVMQWARSYHLPDTASLLSGASGFEAAVLSNGHIAITGAYDFFPTVTNLKDGLILEVDAAGNPVRGMRVNLNFSKHNIYLNHLVALDSNTLVIPGSSVQDTIPSAGEAYNFLFQIRLDDGGIDWQANYFTEIVEGFGTFSNGFSPLPAGYAYLANYAEGFDAYYPYLIVADAEGRTGCQEAIELQVGSVPVIEVFDYLAEEKALDQTDDFEPLADPFDQYDIDVPVLDLGPSELICEPGTKLLDATVQGAESYAWNNGAITPQILAETPGTYFVEDTSFLQCWILRDTVSFNILPPPFVSLAADTTGYCETGQATLVAGVVGADSLFWSTGETTSTIVVTQEGAYSIQAFNKCGTTIESINLVLPDCSGDPEDCRVEMPNAFSPDNDGLNDLFKPLSNCQRYEEYAFRIYSRWGQLVFESSDPLQGWDGRFEQEPMASDLYAWILEYRFPNDETARLEKGEVTLLR